MSEVPADCLLLLSGQSKLTGNYQKVISKVLQEKGAPEHTFLQSVKEKWIPHPTPRKTHCCKSLATSQFAIEYKNSSISISDLILPWILKDKAPLRRHFGGSLLLNILWQNLLLLFVFGLCFTSAAGLCEEKLLWSDSCKSKVQQ